MCRGVPVVDVGAGLFHGAGIIFEAGHTGHKMCKYKNTIIQDGFLSNEQKKTIVLEKLTLAAS